MNLCLSVSIGRWRFPASLIYGRDLLYFSSCQYIWTKLTVHFIFFFYLPFGIICLWLTLCKATAVYMIRDIPLHLHSCLPWTNIVYRTAKKGKQTIRKQICPRIVFSYPSVSVYLSVSLSASFSLPHHLITKIKLHYTPLYWSFGNSRTVIFCWPKEKKANDPWFINWIIPLWPNHSDNVATKFHNCSEWHP